MTKNIKAAVIFGAGLAIGLAIGNAGLAWIKTTLS